MSWPDPVRQSVSTTHASSSTWHRSGSSPVVSMSIAAYRIITPTSARVGAAPSARFPMNSAGRGSPSYRASAG